jgi:hypothetical protein
MLYIVLSLMLGIYIDLLNRFLLLLLLNNKLKRCRNGAMMTIKYSSIPQAKISFICIIWKRI